MVSVGIGLESDGINDSLVVHQLVTLVVGEGEEIVGFGVSDDLVGFDDLGLARLFLRLLDFVEDVLAHDLVIQLGFALAVETEPTDLALDFAVLGLVAVILRPSRHKFCDVIVDFQFTGELAEVVSQRRVGLSRFLEIDDGVRVKIQHALAQEFESFVETETRPTGGETGHENIEVGSHGEVFFLKLIVNFDKIVIDDGDVVYIEGVCVEETVKFWGVTEFFDLRFVLTLPKLAPHGVEHHFGQGSQTRIVLDLVVIQLNALVLIVVVDVLAAFGFVVTYPVRPPAGFLFDLEPCVYVVSEKTLLDLGEMLHLVDVLDLVPQFDGLLQLGSAPRTGQDSLVVGVSAPVGSLQRRFGHFFFHAGGA